MSIILWIIGGFIAVAVAYVLFKLAAAFLGLSLLLGAITWLVFDSFWAGAIIGGVITLIRFISSPGDFLDDAMEDPVISSSGGSSSASDTVRMVDQNGCSQEVEKRLEDASGFYDQYGNRWDKLSDGSYVKR